MTYEMWIVEKINQYKRKRPSDNLILVPVLDRDQNTIGFLRPVTADFRTTITDCIELLSLWRADNPTLSPTRFQVTHEGTERWLDNLVINNDQRILFMVQDVTGNYIGHMGFACFDYNEQSANIDLVVRGKQDISRGLMGYALKALVCWGKQELKLKHIALDVLWDNEHAISFYERCGLKRAELIPLTKREVDGEIRWTVHKGQTFEAEKYYLHMILC